MTRTTGNALIFRWAEPATGAGQRVGARSRFGRHEAGVPWEGW